MIRTRADCSAVQRVLQPRAARNRGRFLNTEIIIYVFIAIRESDKSRILFQTQFSIAYVRNLRRGGFNEYAIFVPAFLGWTGCRYLSHYLSKNSYPYPL